MQVNLVGLVIIALFVIFNKKVINIIVEAILGSEKKRVESEQITKEYTKSMIEFFKAKGRDKLVKAEDALKLQKQFGLKNWKKVLVVSIYYYVIIRIFSSLFKNKTIIFLPFLHSLGWGKTLLLLIFLKFVIKRLIKRGSNKK